MYCNGVIFYIVIYYLFDQDVFLVSYNKGTIVTLTERSTNMALLERWPLGKNAEALTNIVSRRLFLYRERKLGITTDSGGEFKCFNYISYLYIAFYLAVTLRHLILFIILFKFYQNMVFQIKCYVSFYVTRCVSFMTRRIFFMTHCVSFMTHCVTNFYWACKNLKNTIKSILWKQRVLFRPVFWQNGN